MSFLNKLFRPTYSEVDLSVPLLFLRVGMGIAFVMHGADKIAAPFTWMKGAPVPGILQAAAAVSEYYGGMLLAAGLLTRLSAFGLLCTMAVAVVMGHMMQGHPFVNPTGGPSYELAYIYFACALLFMQMGPGCFSLDWLLFKKSKDTTK